LLDLRVAKGIVFMRQPFGSTILATLSKILTGKKFFILPAIIAIVVFSDFARAQTSQEIAKSIDYTKAQQAVVGVDSKTQAPIIDGHLKEVAVTELHTTMMFSGDTMISNDSGAVFVFFGGTGAKTVGYGIGATLEPVAKKIAKMAKEQFHLKADAIGFQNPLYADEEKSHEERRPYIEKYGTTKGQKEWLAKILGFVVDSILKDASGKPTKQIWVSVRSTSSSVFAQLLDEYYQGKKGSEFMSSIEGAIISGFLGHTPEEVADWDKKEIAYLKHHKGLEDTLIQPLGVAIFKDMTYAPNDDNPIPKASSVTSLPKIILLAGSNDFSSNVEYQLGIVERMAKRHPELSITFFGMDTEHNPAAKIEYKNREQIPVAHDRMKRFTPILEGIAAAITGIPTRELKDASKVIVAETIQNTPGLTLFAIDAMFDAPGVESCGNLMSRIGANSIIKTKFPTKKSALNK
jgi:hypothetical protein